MVRILFYMPASIADPSSGHIGLSPAENLAYYSNVSGKSAVGPMQMLTNLIRRTQADQAVDSEYESIDYRVFEPVSYDRLMSWKKGGRIGVGFNGTLEFVQTDADKEDVLLPGGRSVVVIKADFRLKQKPS